MAAVVGLCLLKYSLFGLVGKSVDLSMKEKTKNIMEKTLAESNPFANFINMEE